MSTININATIEAIVNDLGYDYEPDAYDYVCFLNAVRVAGIDPDEAFAFVDDKDLYVDKRLRTVLYNAFGELTESEREAALRYIFDAMDFPGVKRVLSEEDRANMELLSSLGEVVDPDDDFYSCDDYRDNF